MLAGATFVIVADASGARFLRRDRPGEALVELTDLRMAADVQPLARDRSPRVFDRMGPGRHAAERRMTARGAAEHGFLAEVAARAMARIELEQPACIAICAPPAALGVLRRLVRGAGDRVLISVAKGLMKETVLRLDQRLRDLKV